MRELCAWPSDHARRGNAAGARTLLADICTREPDNEVAWLWRASLATTAAEGLAYMDRVLAINPANATALGWLSKMGRPAPTAPAVPPTQAAPPTPPPAPPVPQATPVESLRAAIARPQPANDHRPCALCRVPVEPAAARCPHCRAVLLMKDPADFALSRALDPALAHAAVDHWTPLAASGSIDAILALATVCLNTLDYAGATLHLKKALAQGLPHPHPPLVKDGLLLKTLMQPLVLVVDDSATIRRCRGPLPGAE